MPSVKRSSSCKERGEGKEKQTRSASQQEQQAPCLNPTGKLKIFEASAVIEASCASDLRTWLEQHHTQTESVWLRLYKKKSATPSVSYSEAVDEALCFGWIDSQTKKLDEQSYLIRYSKRKPQSGWSAVNKKNVERLVKEGKITPAGLAAIELAKQKGQWTVPDGAETGELPSDIADRMQKDKDALQHWERFPLSYRRATVEWILSGKKEETRERRVEELLTLTRNGLRRGEMQKKKR
uniref:Bacteriocin-protection protein, YdeI/OmpD-associated family n=1 Tax=Chromera velia CCMP2878 TaxID=1169474 RepID=A0A0G4HDH2_9ALVE|eukprot:Cvel_26296.t1-p1 / transcript=Cvel_26296.t1 / gene=Cvel_26296 / organism=Chromera_velia_CCMP2878 / gene_product=hypothetical protein / transcript_product=hypothetical protein / location=Cvel_scaffold3104:7048-8384(-) / protein_length=237 / sequence_SO=supercontig / SO=protein_coding / is_pseudo=false